MATAVMEYQPVLIAGWRAAAFLEQLLQATEAGLGLTILPASEAPPAAA